jgi:hypothetical protein
MEALPSLSGKPSESYRVSAEVGATVCRLLPYGVKIAPNRRQLIWTTAFPDGCGILTEGMPDWRVTPGGERDSLRTRRLAALASGRGRPFLLKRPRFGFWPYLVSKE